MNAVITTTLPTFFQDDSIVLVTLPGAQFAGEVLGHWSGANTVFYTVRDCKTSLTYFLSETEVSPFMVQARLICGGTAEVQITRFDDANEGDFFCLFMGEEVDLPRSAVQRVLLPTADRLAIAA